MDQPSGPPPSRLQRRQQKQSSFHWTTWLSPKPHAAPRSLRRGDVDVDDGDESASSSPSRRRGRLRSASFDHHPPPGMDGGRRRSIAAVAPRVVAPDNAEEEGGPPPSSSSHSILAVLLLHLDSLLPAYCDRLADVSADAPRSVDSASEAVRPLAGGASTLSSSVASAATDDGDFARVVGADASPREGGARLASSFSAPATPLMDDGGGGGGNSAVIAPSPPDDGTRKTTTAAAAAALVASPRSDATSSPRRSQGGLSGWLSSPRGSPSGRRSRLTSKRNAVVAESEWERFVSPFLMLAGAEVCYARMDHVVDPTRRRAAADAAEGSPPPPPGEGGASDAKKKKKGGAGDDEGGGGGSAFVWFARGVRSGTKDGVVDVRGGGVEGESSTPPATQDASDRRGSRRLVAMYRQIREDLIVVGEYLCDPILGAHASSPRRGEKRGGSASDATTSTARAPPPPPRLPPPPLMMGGTSTTPRSSPERGGATTRSTGDDGGGRCTPLQRREMAAISLRNTLDALIGFVDARCALVEVHAELCFPTKQHRQRRLPSPDDAEGRSRGDKKWTALAGRCRSVMEPVSAWAREGTWRVVSDCEGELRALELLLLSVHHLYECSMFDCVLNVRRLQVLLEKIDERRVRLPTSFARTCLPGLFSLMHVIFSGKALAGPSPNQSSPLQSSGGFSPNRKETRKSLPTRQPNDMQSYFAEFVGKYGSGLPLALMVVHRSCPSLPEEQKGGSTRDGHSESWNPVYMKCNLRDSESVFKHMTENHTEKAQVGNSTSCWPFSEWRGIETALHNHGSAMETSDVTKHYIQAVDADLYNKAVDPNKRLPDNNFSIHQRTKGLPQVVAQCHISSITGSVHLVVIQSIGNSKRLNGASDDNIRTSMQKMSSKLRPENLFCSEVALKVQSDLLGASHSASDRSKSPNDAAPIVSLWSDSNWSDVQQKKILHSLGLRKNSPVMAPLKSPYIRRQKRDTAARKRKKKTKSSLNRGHLDLFLGPELTQLL